MQGNVILEHMFKDEVEASWRKLNSTLIFKDDFPGTKNLDIGGTQSITGSCIFR
jgi:hypothetical protein